MFVSAGYGGSLRSDGSGSVQRDLCVHLSGGASGGMKVKLGGWRTVGLKKNFKTDASGNSQ